MDFIRPKKPSLSLDMAPLIDIVFLLLIFFMLTSSFLNPSLKLNLPSAKEQDPREPQRVIVSVDKSGNIFVNSEKASIETLRAQLTAKLERASEKSVHLRGDEEMHYGLFVQVMDLARQAGARQINIVHKAGK